VIPRPRPPSPIDRLVGRRLRELRRRRGLSQSDLALALGVTFQQVQKYERGTSRLSAGKLFDASRALAAPVSEFFEGVETFGQERGPYDNLLADDLAMSVALTFPRIEDQKVRLALARLVRELAGAAD